jgi:hypothetical protein
MSSVDGPFLDGFIYATLLIGTVVYIFVRGRADERVVVGTLVAGSVATYIIFKYFGQSFTALQWPMLLNESAVLAVLLTVALRSKRFWPIPVASFQLAAFLSLLTPYFGENIISHGLGVAQGVWAYPQLAILVLGTIRGKRRQQRNMLKAC